MTRQWQFRVIVPIAFGVGLLGCNQQTQSLYKVEIERQCHNCDLRGVNLAGETLSGKYRVSVSNRPLSTGPEGLNYAQPVDLTGSDLRDSNLRDANLSEVILNRTQLANADLSNADLQDAQLVGADLRQANLRGANLSGTNFQDANLKGADLRDCNLQAANLQGANLADALFDQPL